MLRQSQIKPSRLDDLNAGRTRSRTVKEKGSTLIIALLVAGIFGFITSSYLRSTLTELNIANSDFTEQNLVNVTHAGAEIALRALNEDDWTGWVDSSPWMIESLYNLDMGNGNTATMYLYVLDQAPNPIRIYSIVYLYLTNGEMVQKNFYADLRRRSIFPNGITTHDDIVFYNAGTVKVDSYTSDPAVNLGIYDPFFNQNDHGSLVGAKVLALELAKGEVEGYVSTWVEPHTIGVNGKIYGDSTPVGIDVDDSRVADGFEPNFPDVPVPAGVTSVYSFPGGNDTLPGAGAKERLVTGDLFIDDLETLTITEDMTIVVQDDVHIDGILKVADGVQLKLYIADDFTLHHNLGKVENFSGDPGSLGDPGNLIIYSTDTGTFSPNYYIGGGSAFYGALYAPRADVNLEAGGEMFGAIVAANVDFLGNYDFHFDENLNTIVGDNPTYRSDFSRNY